MTRAAALAAELERLASARPALPVIAGRCGKPGCTIDHSAAGMRKAMREARSARGPVIRDAAFELRKARRMAMTGGCERLIASRDPRVTFPDYATGG